MMASGAIFEVTEVGIRTPKEIKQEELGQWELFSVLYRHVFADVCFKPNNVYNSKNNKVSFK
mgnify:CR=1 FL=1